MTQAHRHLLAGTSQSPFVSAYLLRSYSISEVLMPAPKKRKKTMKQSLPKIGVTKDTFPIVSTEKITSKEPPKSSTIKSKPLNTVKKLHISEKKTASGGVHLTFNSTDSSSESSSSDDEMPTPSIKTNKPVSPIKPMKPPVKPVEPLPNTRGGKQARSKVRGGRQRRSLPSSVVIGGPNDIHTTHSTVYTNTGEDESSVNKSTLVEKDATSTGWDVQPDDEPPVSAMKDYSNFPDLDGAPRVGDQLAFKVIPSTFSIIAITCYCLCSCWNSLEAVLLKYRNINWHQ